MTEGTIKFNCKWEKGELPILKETFTRIESARAWIYSLGMIGIPSTRDGIGYGNISVRGDDAGTFIISGTATGGLRDLKQSDYALVTGYNISENTIECTGLTQASSESLTHAAIYQSCPEVNAVIHGHCLWLWKKLLNDYPTTSAEIEYGTPEMAYAVGKLASEINYEEEKIIVMGGHREGILVFDSSPVDATVHFYKIYQRYMI